MKRNEKKIQCLKRQMEDYAKKDVIVAFSGGVDSSLLLKLACEAALKSKRKVYAVFFIRRCTRPVTRKAPGGWPKRLG